MTLQLYMPVKKVDCWCKHKYSADRMDFLLKFLSFCAVGNAVSCINGGFCNKVHRYCVAAFWGSSSQFTLSNRFQSDNGSRLSIHKMWQVGSSVQRCAQTKNWSQSQLRVLLKSLLKPPEASCSPQRFLSILGKRRNEWTFFFLKVLGEFFKYKIWSKMTSHHCNTF